MNDNIYVNNFYREKEIFHNGFSTFFKKEIFPEVVKLENKRQKVIKKKTFCLYSLYISIPYMLFSFVVLSLPVPLPELIKTILLILTIVAAIFIICSSNILSKQVFSEIKELKTKLKDKMLIKLINYVGSFKLGNKKDIDTKKLLKYGLSYILPKFVVEHMGKILLSMVDDYIIGTYKGVDIELIEMYDKQSVDAPSILTITFPSFKKFSGKTHIISNNIENSALRGSGEVHLEDPEFSKSFKVFSSDQVEARYILNPAFMNRLLILKQEFIGKKSYSLTFSSGTIVMTITSNCDWFDVDISKNISDSSAYYEIAYQLYLICSIIDTLKLDQNIEM